MRRGVTSCSRSVVLSLLCVISCVYLLFQVFYFRVYVSTPGPHILSRTGHLTASDVQWQTVRSFLLLAQRYELAVFLADPAALSLLTQDALLRRDQLVSEPHCSFLCTAQPITAFALIASQWKYDPAFLLAVEQEGFSMMEIRGADPRLAGMDDLSGEDIPLHFLFRLKGYIIQLVLLYERSGNYLWFGSVRLRGNADRSFAPFKRLDYGRHDGALDRPALVLTVIDGLSLRVPRNVSSFLSDQRHAHFLECRYRDARNFLQRFPDDVSPVAVSFRGKVKSLLRVASQTLRRINVPFWISSGTCLGWFRQCSVISYSRDVDIGVFVSDYSDDIIPAFRDAGLSLKHRFGKVEDSLELSFLLDDVKLDIFFFYENGDVMWNGGTQARSGRKYKYIFPLFSLCWAELLEVKVRVPCQTLDYVTANYGSSWSVPLATWDWKTSPSNVQDNGVWPVSEWAELIQVY